MEALINGVETTDAEVNQVATYYICGEVFGYTPEQVDSIDGKVLQGMLMFHGLKGKLENEMINKAKKGR